MAIQEKEKKPSAMSQVHNKVNAGIMDAVTCGGMCEAAEPEDEEYEIGLEEGGLEPYAHVQENRKTMFVTESQIKALKLLLENEKKMNFDYKKYIASFIDFLKSQHLGIDPLPKIELKDDEQDGLFIKTGYYDPEEMKVVAYVNGRHPKDVMRTVAHEFVHHMQNIQDPNKDWGSNGDLEQDRKLRGIEGEAFLLGNILFREWTEYAKKHEKNLNESILKESPDAIYDGEKHWRDDEAIPFMFYKPDNNFYIGENGQSHIQMMAELGADDEELDDICDDESFEKFVDIERTGRYWTDVNVISFWKTPINRPEKLSSTVGRVADSVGIDCKYLLVDWWETGRESQIPYTWFFNGTFEMLNTQGIEQIYPLDAYEYDRTNKYTTFLVMLKNGTHYKLDASGNFIENQYQYSYLNEGKKKVVKNDKGEVVPETCDKCGGKVGLYIQGEPIYKCSKCGKYFGTMPFSRNLNERILTRGDFDKYKISPEELEQHYEKTRKWGEKLLALKKRRDPDNIEDWDKMLTNEITSELIEPDDVDLSSFNIKRHLNPKFWEDGHLDTRIRLKLLDIADDFFDSLGVDWVEPVDVIMTGSLANYNWNKKYSDIDLHVLVDYEDVDDRVDFVREYFTLKKNEWNQKHKGLRIFGFPVEVYVQDANEPHASSGVYSIDRDEWITEPDMEKIRSGKVDKKHIREMVSTYMNKIDCLIDIYKHHRDDKHELEKIAKDAAEMIDEIKKMRSDDLKKYSREMCDGNIIFKALRRSDYIGKLIKLKNLTYDKLNSI